jgi:hypothetical protein
MIRVAKSLAIVATLAAVAALTITPNASAMTGSAVQLKERPSKIHGNGSVTIRFWLRCPAGYNAFEVSIGVRQGDIFGSASAGPTADLLICDGSRHPHALHVMPEQGSWHRGYADLSISVQISTGGGADISAEDVATSWLYTDR